MAEALSCWEVTGSAKLSKDSGSSHATPLWKRKWVDKILCRSIDSLPLVQINKCSENVNFKKEQWWITVREWYQNGVYRGWEEMR